MRNFDGILGKGESKREGGIELEGTSNNVRF